MTNQDEDKEYTKYELYNKNMDLLNLLAEKNELIKKLNDRIFTLQKEKADLVQGMLNLIRKASE